MSDPVHAMMCGPDGCKHVALTQDEARALFEAARHAEAKRAADMPTEQDAICAMHEAWSRLKELGWREAIYAPECTPIEVIEAGSTGIHNAERDRERRFWIDGEWPSRPVLFREAGQHSEEER